MHRITSHYENLNAPYAKTPYVGNELRLHCVHVNSI